MFPSPEAVRKAVQRSLHAGLAATQGDWFVALPDGREATFQPHEAIEVRAYASDQELTEGAPESRTYRFRVVVEALPEE